MAPGTLIQQSLVYGLLMSVLASAALLGGLYLNPEIGWRTYPPAVKAAFGPMSAQARKGRVIAGLIFIGVLIIVPVVALLQLDAQADGGLSFGEAFFSAFIVLSVFNLVDLLVIDWLIFATIQPRFILLPGTEGMAEYGDYGFYFAGFVKGLVASIVASGLLAALVALL